MMEITAYALSEAKAWEERILLSDSYSFFHSMAWARVLVDSYGYSPLYLIAHEGPEIAALPLMGVRGIMPGRKYICLPFSDSCGPVCTSQGIQDALIRAVISIAEKKGWKSVEIHENPMTPGFSPHARFFEHSIPLSDDSAAMMKRLRSSTKRNIQHAEREGVHVTLEASLEAVDSYYRLHCITRKKHGVPPQPLSFFHSIHEHVIKQGNGFISRARYGRKTVSAVMFLHFGKKAVMKFAASLPDVEHLRPNNLAMWEAMKWYSSNGFDSISLGRTDVGDRGLMQYKNGWGGESKDLLYYRWPQRDRDLSKRSIGKKLASSAFRSLPVSALRSIGKHFYKYMG